MKNVDMDLDGDKLGITVNLAKEFGGSKSGKLITIVLSEENILVTEHEEIKIGLNVYRKK